MKRRNILALVVTLATSVFGSPVGQFDQTVSHYDGTKNNIVVSENENYQHNELGSQQGKNFVIKVDKSQTAKHTTSNDYATGGGILKGTKFDNSTPQVSLEQLQVQLRQYKDELTQDQAFIASSETTQSAYLQNIELFNTYVASYIQEKGACLIMEDQLKINPPPYYDEIQEREEQISRCYKRAETSLMIHGDIVGNMKNSYKYMKKLQRRAEGKMMNIDALNKSIASMESAIAIVERQKD